MRASADERSLTVSLLQRAHVDGRIGLDTFEWRLKRALSARHGYELDALVDDIDERPAVWDLLRARFTWAMDHVRSRLAPAPTVPTVTVPFPPRVAGREYVIGRAPDCDLVVADPTVSRTHAALEWRDDEWELKDLGSRNGTTVDGWRVSHALVDEESEIRVGAVALRLRGPAN